MKKIKDFIRKYHAAIIGVLIVLLFIRGCQIDKRDARANKSRIAYENTIDSLSLVIKDNRREIKELNSKIHDLTETVVIYKEQVGELRADKNALRKVNSDNAKAIKNLSFHEKID